MAQPFADPVQIINRAHPSKIAVVIAFAAGILFLPFLGSVHLFDWDEINFAEAAREMLVTRDFLHVQINFQPFHEKPPLFIWMQAISMNIFGINEFAARFPNALCGITTLLIVFAIGRTLRNNLFGVIWVLAYSGSVLPLFYFKSGIIDPWFNLFIFLGTWFLFLIYHTEKKKKNLMAIISGLFTGLAILTKGPVALLITGITFFTFILYRRSRTEITFRQFLLFSAAAIITGGSWFVFQIIMGDKQTVYDFILYQIRLFSTKDAGHGGFPGFHAIILLLAVFPASILALRGFKKTAAGSEPLTRFILLMQVLLIVVLVIFSLVRTKIVHYSSLAYFPVTFLAADFLFRAHQGETTWRKWMSVAIMIITSLYSILIILISFGEQIKNKAVAEGWVSHPFSVEKLKNQVTWSGYEWIPGVLFLLAVPLVLFYVKKHRTLLRGILLFMCTMFFTISAIYTVTPKIEKYIQNGYVNTLKSLADEDIYLWNYNFRSYATWFYGQIKPPPVGKKVTEEWLLHGDIDKDVYFFTKVHRAAPLQNNPDIQYVGKADGFVFYRRVKK